eukprot:9052302-Karenia_brevis.AAC.1
MVVDSGSISGIDLGSDHKAVCTTLKITCKRRRRNKVASKRTATLPKAWCPKDEDAFNKLVDKHWMKQPESHKEDATLTHLDAVVQRIECALLAAAE